MINNNLKLTIRDFFRNKTISLINITGLAIGIACTLLILIWVQYELSYDKFYKNHERIYRIQRDPFATLAPSFVPLMEQDYPEIDNIVRIAGGNRSLIKYKERTFLETLYFVESDFFELFDLQIIKGNVQGLLQNPGEMIISKSMAEKYFGEEDPIGKQINIDQQFLVKVTAVFEDLPENSHMEFDILVSYLSLKGLQGEGDDDYFFGTKNFSDNVCYTYAKLGEYADPKKIEESLPEFIDRHLDGFEDSEGNYRKQSEFIPIELIKLTDIHLHSHKMAEWRTNGDIKYVKIFSLVAIFILVIACINFINLTNAKNQRRIKEVFIRIVNGANKKTLFVQFLGDTLFYVIISFLFALIIVETLLPYYTNYWEIEKTSIISNWSNIFMIIIILLSTTLITGVYPGLSLSNIKFTEFLKGRSFIQNNIVLSRSNNPFRKFLIIFQFALSLILIICLGVISKQTYFIHNANLGFDKNNILLLPVDNYILNHWDKFKQEILKTPGVKYVTRSKRTMTDRLLDDPGFKIFYKDEIIRNSFKMPHIRVEYDFLKTYDIDIVAGRDFDENISSDTREAVILNEIAVKKLGFTNNREVLDLKVRVNGTDRKVIGVCQDFHYESLHQEIPAMVIYIDYFSTILAVKLNGKDINKTVNAITEVWNSLHPTADVNYTFMDEKINGLYRQEQRMLNLFQYFSLLAILIACLGLLGLSSFISKKRTKEIGIRKVNGATIFNIITMLNLDFVKWVIIAFIIACPVAYYFMNMWLQNFAYRTNMSWWIFILSGIIALMVALLTISWQSWRAANRNPVEALRYE